MGIIQTADWLDADFDSPVKVCEKLLPAFDGQSAIGIFNQLAKFGMYRPSRETWNIFNSLKKNNIWNKAEHIFQKYKKKWVGPDIPIYLFPIDQPRRFFSRQEKIKGGVSYSDKMFLFLSDRVTSKELESLFVHEYHHVCRLNKQKKSFQELTLLDSIIIEGLAEYAVLKNCGREFLAHWCSLYTEKETIVFWRRFLQDHLNKKKNDRGHDERLYGGGGLPNLLGYAVGYKIIENYYQNHNYSTKLSFYLPSSEYLENQRVYLFKKPVF